MARAREAGGMGSEVSTRSEQLLRIMTVINSSLSLDEVLENTMDQLILLTGAERGAIAFVDPADDYVQFAVARNIDGETLEDDRFDVSRTLIRKVAETGQGEMLLSAMDDPRYAQNKSIVAKGLRSVLCVPLITRRDEVLGVVWIDNKMQAGVFKKEDLEMLTEFGRHAANAIDHANKYGALLEMKSYQDSIFESLGSGLLAIDNDGRITAFNLAAESIFALSRDDVMHQPLREALHGRAADIFGQVMDEVLQSGRPILGRQHSGHFAGAGRVELTLNAAPLLNHEGYQIGVTMIIDDISERLALEAERDQQVAEKKKLRATLGRLVSEDVARLVAEDVSEDSQGRIRDVSCLFVDIVGFTARCEELSPERVIQMLNHHFSEMCEIVARNQGTVKQFVGDEMMVLFNAARETPDHQMLAVWTAIEMVDRLRQLHALDPHSENGFYEVKIGIHSGPVVYGAVGAQDRMEFAAVGDTVNLTSRVMGLNPRLGTRILISEDVYFEIYKRVSRSVELIPHGAQPIRGRNMPIKVYEVRSSDWKS